MIVLGIETSCDETAAAVVRRGADGDGTILSNEVLSQIDVHKPYGGIVPEVAARSHLDHIDTIVDAAMKKAGVSYDQLDAVAATGGPGLIGGVIVGVMTAKAIAAVHDKPFVAVNHLEGHALTPRLTRETPEDAAFPYLLLLVSGGHCQLQVVEGPGRYTRLGTTIDDALGEAFEKVAKMLGLGYPGGPVVEAAAAKGDAQRFALPRPLKGKPGCHFSFSGLKAAVRRGIEALPEGPLADADINDMCAGFQTAATESLVNRCKNAIATFQRDFPGGSTLVVSGGVAANTFIRGALEDLAAKSGLKLAAPPLGLCTDNAAMIAWAAIERLAAGDTPDSLDFAPRPRWPLDPDAPSAAGAGVKA